MTTVADYLISGSHNLPVAVIEYRQFMKKLPAGFYKGRDGKIHHNSDQLNLFICGDKNNIFATASKKVAKIKNQEDFHEMRQRLMTKPILFNVKLVSKYVQHFVIVQITTTTKMFAMVYVNPTHPVIKAQLENHFDKCEQLMSEGKHFSFEIRVNDIMKMWYMMKIGNASASYFCYGSTICVTNFRQRCNMCYNPTLWLVPFTWLLAPPYLIYRALSSKDVICELSAIVTMMKQGCPIRIQQNMAPEDTNTPPSYEDSQRTPSSIQINSPQHPIFSFTELAPQHQNQNAQSDQDDAPLQLA